MISRKRRRRYKVCGDPEGKQLSDEDAHTHRSRKLSLLSNESSDHKEAPALLHAVADSHKANEDVEAVAKLTTNKPNKDL